MAVTKLCAVGFPLQDRKIDLLAVALSNVDPNEHAVLSYEVGRKFSGNSSAPAFIGALPRHPVLDHIRLDEVQAALKVRSDFKQATQLLDRPPWR